MSQLPADVMITECIINQIAVLFNIFLIARLLIVITKISEN